MATYKSTVENPRTRWVTEVRKEHANPDSNKLWWWCRCVNCCTSTSSMTELRTHYKEWHPGVNHEPLDVSTYANSRHVLGSAYVPGIDMNLRQRLKDEARERYLAWRQANPSSEAPSAQVQARESKDEPVEWPPELDWDWPADVFGPFSGEYARAVAPMLVEQARREKASK
jgi:hypothetical protein